MVLATEHALLPSAAAAAHGQFMGAVRRPWWANAAANAAADADPTTGASAKQQQQQPASFGNKLSGL